MPLSLRAFAVPLVLCTVLAACGGGNTASQLAKVPDFAPKDQTKCGVTKSQAKPLIVEWPSADRGELEAQAHNRGLVVVRYQGCEMQVLDGCTTSVRYGYAPITRKKDRVVMRDADDLYANVPIGAARLEAKLEKSGELDVDMTMVGRWEAERRTVRADELQGSCDGATHVVSALTVGAFTFTAGADATVGGGATVLGAGGGGHSTSKRETLNADGDASACEKATSADKGPPEDCGALLRVEVVPLGAAKTFAPTCPDGTQWDGSQCVGKKVVTQVDCPAGSNWDGIKCAAAVDTNCGAGLHFVPGRGCVPDLAQGQVAPLPSPVQGSPASLPSSPTRTDTSDVPFDMGEAKARLASIAGSVQGCKKGDVSGSGRIVVTFAPAGNVSSAVVSGPPFEGTPTGACIAGRFRTAHVPAFSGNVFSISKSFTIN